MLASSRMFRAADGNKPSRWAGCPHFDPSGCPQGWNWLVLGGFRNSTILHGSFRCLMMFGRPPDRRNCDLSSVGRQPEEPLTARRPTWLWLQGVRCLSTSLGSRPLAAKPAWAKDGPVRLRAPGQPPEPSLFVRFGRLHPLKSPMIPLTLFETYCLDLPSIPL